MNIYDFEVADGAGNPVSLSEYKGKVLLIINTATKCWFTKQYAGLQELYSKYRDSGFEILDFPCNQFKRCAPGTEAEIADFCKINFGVSFKQFAKIKVNGKEADPLYIYLKSQKSGENGERIRWNFIKFLVDREGNVVDRFDSRVTPAQLEERIKELLQ